MPLDRDALEVLRMNRDAEDRARHRRGRHFRLGALVVGIVVLAAAAWWWLAPHAVEVRVVAARKAAFPAAAGGVRILNASGYVVARRRATVSAKITGKLIAVNVEEGHHVEVGQVLARLDDKQARAQFGVAASQLAAARSRVLEARARLARASVNYRRIQHLRAAGLTSEADLDNARADFKELKAALATAHEQVGVAQSTLAEARQGIADTVIRAPFSGVVISKDAQAGEIVSPISAGGGFTRTGICTLVDMSSLEIEVDVNEAYIQKVHAGQAIDAILDAYPDWHVPGQVVSIVPAADRQKATVKVRIAFNRLDPRILPDMGVQVWFLQSARPGDTVGPQVLVPREAIHRTGDRSYVFVLQNGHVRRRDVKTGLQQDNDVAIQSGVTAGEQVVTGAASPLTDGMAVRVREK